MVSLLYFDIQLHVASIWRQEFAGALLKHILAAVNVAGLRGMSGNTKFDASFDQIGESRSCQFAALLSQRISARKVFFARISNSPRLR
jgi:hypothetical protein